MSQNSKAPAQLRLTMKNGPLAQIWLASNLNTINRNIAKTNILESVEEIAKAAGVDVDLDHSAVEPITPVSYTHLDVYKRQEECKSRPRTSRKLRNVF